jgi:hypothetical protein
MKQRKPDVASQRQFEQYNYAAVAASQGMPNDRQVLQAKNPCRRSREAAGSPMNPMSS